MVERQPRDPRLRVVRRDDGLDGGDVGEHVLVRERDGFRVDRRAAGELDQEQVGRTGSSGKGRSGPESPKSERRARLCDRDAEEPRDARVAENEPSAADLQHPRGAPVELVHAPETNRRVERHRHRARQHRAEERIHELRAGGKDDGDAVAALDAQLAQGAGGSARPLVHFRE